MKSVMTLQQATKQFGSLRAMDQVSFTVQPGEIVGFVGANGAGKTTTISAILGFIAPTSGKLSVFNEVVTLPKAHSTHHQIGYAAGDMELPRRLTGQQYLQFVMSRVKGDHSKKLDVLRKIFSPQLEKKISTLSRGNKQKIALIAAFVTNPKLVVLDEPTSGLDPVMQEAFLDLIRAEAKHGTTIFMSSHYLNEVADVCSRVILMRSGRVIKDVSADELLRDSGKHVRVVTGYLATKPPKGASSVKAEKQAKELTLSFVWKSPTSNLQRWVAGLKQLRDIEITEYNLEGAFEEMYAEDEKDSSV